MKIASDFKEKIRQSILEDRKNFGGSDKAYANSLGIHPTAYSTLKTKLPEGILVDGKWMSIARKLGVSKNDDKWVTVETVVYREIRDNLKKCQDESLSMVLVDNCGIGKTYCASRIIKKMTNAFYIDCSQCKSKIKFIRAIAKAIGVDINNKYDDIKEDLKYALSNLDLPLVVLDEAGDLDYNAFLDLKELSNATTDRCGWYMMGADGLRAKIERGIKNKKVGFNEIFDRYSYNKDGGKFIKISPTGEDKQSFYIDLIGSVATANTDQSEVQKLVKRCLADEASLRLLKKLIKSI